MKKVYINIEGIHILRLLCFVVEEKVLTIAANVNFDLANTNMIALPPMLNFLRMFK